MFSKILIANRGEIACRIIRTCRRMGIRTVAVYSEADANALHVRMADEAFPIGPPPPSRSYLNIPRILEVARRAGADALHPGYGFLAQNSAFVRACQEKGITFIGPSPQVMERMADKLLARRLAKEAGLPLLPGTDGEVDENDVLEHAHALGFPLMVKATAGGGGIGISLVHSEEGLLKVMQKMRTLAQNAFGSPRLYLEGYLEQASHLEVQVLGNSHGHVIHLYERDCSLQRRYQKVVEETPSVKLTPEQRQRLTGYALALARHIGYTGAGAVEFLVSRGGDIHFLEMNTRLQVEHGITEMVTGLDRVELQIRIAAGEPLPLSQEDVKVHGHAMEARIYPEDPETFIPSAGVVHHVEEPTGEHLRVDSALFPGYEVTTHYDPLLSKVMAWGERREEALKRLYTALRRFRIEGVSTNIPALRSAIAHPAFMSGNYDTSLLAKVVGVPRGEVTLAPLGEDGREDKERAAAIAVAILLSRESRFAPTTPRPASGGGPSPWKLYGRREQMLSRAQGRRSWR